MKRAPSKKKSRFRLILPSLWEQSSYNGKARERETSAEIGRDRREGLTTVDGHCILIVIIADTVSKSALYFLNSSKYNVQEGQHSRR